MNAKQRRKERRACGNQYFKEDREHGFPWLGLPRKRLAVYTGAYLLQRYRERESWFSCKARAWYEVAIAKVRLED